MARTKDLVPKVRMHVTMTPDTMERARQLAFQHHTNVFQLITNLIWSAKFRNTQKGGTK